MITSTGTLATVVRRLVLGAFVCTALVIVVLLGEAVLSALGVLFDPHGLGMIAGVLSAVVLAPVALVLWLVYSWLRRRAA